MSRKVDKTTKGDQVAFVEALQNAVQNAPEYGDDFRARVKEANERFFGKRAQLSLKVSSENARSDRVPSLRITCPSRSVVSADIPSSLSPEYVEFYLTRPRADGVAETRLLGVSKYKDGDGKWNVTFTTERFARKPNDSLVIHAEVLSRESRLIASVAVVVVD